MMSKGRAPWFGHALWLHHQALRRLTWVLSLLAASLAWSRAAHAGSSDCRQLGAALADHSCFHATYGPYETVWAAAEPQSAPHLNAPHTYYRLGLIGPVSIARYSPSRSAEWAFFWSGQTKLTVRLGDQVLTPVFSSVESTDCAALASAQVYSLEVGVSYDLYFEGTGASESFVAEVVLDFIVEHGRDEDGDGYGSRIDTRWSVCAPDPGFAANTADCDDTDPRVHPGATESCDPSEDLNCNGSPTDEGLPCSIGVGVCASRGRLQCEGISSSPLCVSATAPLAGTPETCNGLDDNCDGQVDEGEDLCPTIAAPACVGIGASKRCGCSLDIDCGSRDSGRICNLGKKTCEAGCRAGGNGCPSGERCMSMSAALGSGEVGSCGLQVTPEPIAAPAPEEPSHEAKASCGCSVPGRGAGSKALLLLVPGLAVLLRRRRR